MLESIDWYQRISNRSPYFDDMLYEVAWAYVHAAQLVKKSPKTQDSKAPHQNKERKFYEMAQRSVDLLLAASPKPQLFAQAKVLQGNLQIRLGAPETAYGTFEAIVKRFGGARGDMATVVARQRGLFEFFDDLVDADLEQLSKGGAVLPPLAVSMVLESEDIATAVEIRKTLANSKNQLLEARQVIRTLDAALQGEQRFVMFAGLKSVRVRALALENRLLEGQRRAVEIERAILGNHLAADALVDLDTLRLKAKSIEDQIRIQPRSGEGVRADREKVQKQYEAIALRVFVQAEQVSKMREQLAASQKYSSPKKSVRHSFPRRKATN